VILHSSFLYVYLKHNGVVVSKN